MLGQQILALQKQQFSEATRTMQAGADQALQKMLNDIDALTAVTQKTAQSVNTGLNASKDLDIKLWQSNNNFTAYMHDRNWQQLKLTMQWFLERSEGFDTKICAYIHNPMMRNMAETLCDINSYFKVYLKNSGSLVNPYNIQLPELELLLYGNFTPQPYKDIFES